MFYWLRRLLGIRAFSASSAVGRIPPVAIGPLLATDIPACRELYKLNEPGRFPPNLMEEYERTLAAKGTAFLVARMGGELVGAGGLMRLGGEASRGIGLAFGLVHPAWQRRGFGSALLLARLAALPEPDPYWNIALSAVESAQTFYQQFGFMAALAPCEEFRTR